METNFLDDLFASGDSVWSSDMQESTRMPESIEQSQTLEDVLQSIVPVDSDPSYPSHLQFQRPQDCEIYGERDPDPLPISLKSQPCAIPVNSVLLTRRRLKSDHCALVKFTREKGGPVKHEYYGVMLVRGLKKAMRVAGKTAKKFPSIGLYKSIIENPNAMKKWKAFTEVYQLYQDVLHGYSLTGAEPGVTGHTREHASNLHHRSFSKSFLHSFFTSAYLRAAFYYYTEVAFSPSPDVLCECFKFKCCQRPTHSSACEALWAELKVYTQTGFLEEVGWPAFSNSNSV